MLAFSFFFLFKFYFLWGLTSFIPSLSKQVVSSYSPSRCWLFQFFLFLMEFHIFYTNTLQAGLRFILSMEVLGYTLQADVGLFNLVLFNLNFSWGFAYFILSLSKQVVSSHSPYRCMVYTLQADVGFFFLIIFHEVSYFHTLTPQAGCRLSLSFYNVTLYNVQSLFFMGFDIFHTITLQAGCKFSLSKQMLAFPGVLY